MWWSRLGSNQRPPACEAGALPYPGICAVPLGWTIVVLRTGRRSRPLRADVAQLVAHHLAKVRVAGSNPVIRSKVQLASIPAVEWPSGEATACKAVHTGSIPVSTSSFGFPGAISSAGERFPDTEEVTGSIPVSRTTFDQVSGGS
jgi:hypothetical protein